MTESKRAPEKRSAGHYHTTVKGTLYEAIRREAQREWDTDHPLADAGERAGKRRIIWDLYQVVNGERELVHQAATLGEHREFLAILRATLSEPPVRDAKAERRVTTLATRFLGTTLVCRDGDGVIHREKVGESAEVLAQVLKAMQTSTPRAVWTKAMVLRAARIRTEEARAARQAAASPS